MTLFIALLLLHLSGHLNALTVLGTLVLWVAHLIAHNNS